MTFFDKALGYAVGLLFVVVLIGGLWSLAQIIGGIIAAPEVCAGMAFGFLYLTWLAQALTQR